MLYVVGEVTGVTYLDNIMYVVCARCSTICLYNTDTYSPLDQVLEVDGMQDPTDIVVCVDDRQLYIADWDNGSPCIWRTSVDGQSSEEFLPTTAIHHVETLSVTSRRLLVTSRHSLKQYNTTDKQLHVVELSHITNLQLCHGIETTRQTFVVGYRTPLWQYAVSNMLGLVIKVKGKGKCACTRLLNVGGGRS